MTVQIQESTDIDTCIALRFRVFVEEQGIPAEDDHDADDARAVHLLARQNGLPVGTARLLFDDKVATIGRVCVVPEARGTGLGAGLILKGVEVARERPGITHVRLGAQTHALAFYERLGFTAFGAVYDDVGIPHRKMELPL